MHRALRCLPATTAALTLVSPFALALEDAAGRAWLRRVSSQTRPYTRDAAFLSSKPVKKGRARSIFNRRNTDTPRHLSEAEISHDTDGCPAELASPSMHRTAASSQSSVPWAGPCFPPANASEASLPDPTLPKPTRSPTPKASTISSLPLPLSPQMFFDNLRFVSSKPLPDVEELIKYHDSRPHFQSPETYNICIKFAISHGQYDIARRLFDAMTKAEIYFDSITYQLLVRLHARQFSAQANDPSDGPLLQKESKTVEEMLSIIHNSQFEIEPEQFLRRILSCLRPAFSGSEVHPKVIKVALYSIVERHMTLAAAELTSAYFSSLPTVIDEETKRHCLDMIHLLLSINTKRGLIDCFGNRRLLKTLLEIHRSLQPTPKTLFLLLSPLQNAKKCGTVAMRLVKSFQKSWGNGVVDFRVRKRVIKLAEKEGRLDIVEKLKR